MYKQIVKDYFSFTKKERLAIIVLMALIFVIFLLPYLIPQRKPVMDIAALRNVQKELTRSHNEADTSHNQNLQADADLSFDHKQESIHGKAYVKREMFYFDPNTLSAAGWQKLGVPDKTIKTIYNYVSKGGKFRQKGDISKIYGLHPELAKRLMPYIRLTAEPAFTDQRKQYKQPAYTPSRPDYIQTVFSKEIIDLNATDTTALIALPGIGSKLAARIVLFRGRLGGFYEVDQLKEIYGLPDSTFQRIKFRLQVSVEGLQKININTADVEILKSHPYIRWNIANAIMQYRMQHGNFNRVEDIGAIGIITKDLQTKLLPYFTVN
ncbi:MAG: helix-hairpin-helix domain-containing protein [Chitinophagaceae bacterium]